MIYTVKWKTVVLDRLAEIYVDCTIEERDRIAGGVAALNKQLMIHPNLVGESREGFHRMVFVPLLAVGFVIDENLLVVRVTSVTRYGR